MKKQQATHLILGLLLVAVFGYLAYSNVPRTKTAVYQVFKMAAEQRTRTYTTTVKVDGEDVEVTVPISETTYKPVPEERTREVLPTLKDYFRFAIVLGAVLFAFYYVWVVFSALNRDKKAGARPTADTKDTQARADRIFTFLVGLIVGFVSADRGEQLFQPPATNVAGLLLSPIEPPSPAASDDLVPNASDLGTPNYFQRPPNEESQNQAGPKE